MPINVLCPTCQKELAAPDELAGQVAECPYCQNRFQVNPPNKANAQTVRMPVPAQRGNPGVANVGAKVSMGGAPTATSYANPPVDPNASTGKQKKSANDEKSAGAMRDNYPPVMPPLAAQTPLMPQPPLAPPATASQPAVAMPPVGMAPVSMPSVGMSPPPGMPQASVSMQPPAGPLPPVSNAKDPNAVPPVPMPPIARQAVGSVSMPAPPGSSSKAGYSTSQANTGNKAPKPSSTKRRTNRAVFKTSDTAKSQVHLGADGRLPELQLEEGIVTERSTEEKKQTNPMLLLAVLGFSVGMSVLMLLYEGSSEATADQSKVQARRIISESYMNGNPLEPYQILLREALQANAQGKYDLERRRYRNVLDMLHSEGRSKMEGLTGLAEPAANNAGAPNDRELERQLSILLSN